LRAEKSVVPIPVHVVFLQLLSESIGNQGIFCAEHFLGNSLLPQAPAKRKLSRNTYRLRVTSPVLVTVVMGSVASNVQPGLMSRREPCGLYWQLAPPQHPGKYCQSVSFNLVHQSDSEGVSKAAIHNTPSSGLCLKSCSKQ